MPSLLATRKALSYRRAVSETLVFGARRPCGSVLRDDSRSGTALSAQLNSARELKSRQRNDGRIYPVHQRDRHEASRVPDDWEMLVIAIKEREQLSHASLWVEGQRVC